MAPITIAYHNLRGRAMTAFAIALLVLIHCQAIIRQARSRLGAAGAPIATTRERNGWSDDAGRAFFAGEIAGHTSANDAQIQMIASDEYFAESG